MKIHSINIFYATLLFSLSAYSQGTFIYDQQSATEITSGGIAYAFQSFQPTGQSFTPTLSSVGFVRLYLADGNPNNNFGATVYVNLRSGSITGPILSSTTPVFMPDGFGIGTGNQGYVNFFFSIPVSVTPGVTYFFQPILQSGDTWALVSYNYNYSGGTAFSQGIAALGSDLWFREGVVAPVPEPSSITLLLLGIGVFACLSRFRKRCNA